MGVIEGELGPSPAVLWGSSLLLPHSNADPSSSSSSLSLSSSSSPSKNASKGQQPKRGQAAIAQDPTALAALAGLHPPSASALATWATFRHALSSNNSSSGNSNDDNNEQQQSLEAQQQQAQVQGGVQGGGGAGGAAAAAGSGSSSSDLVLRPFSHMGVARLKGEKSWSMSLQAMRGLQTSGVVKGHIGRKKITRASSSSSSSATSLSAASMLMAAMTAAHEPGQDDNEEGNNNNEDSSLVVVYEVSEVDLDLLSVALPLSEALNRIVSGCCES